MKINEILIESQLQEGPMLDKFGKAVGGVASGVAKGVGAVAGGIAGMGSAFKKGFSAGKTTVAGDDEAAAVEKTSSAVLLMSKSESEASEAAWAESLVSARSICDFAFLITIARFGA